MLQRTPSRLTAQKRAFVNLGGTTMSSGSTIGWWGCLSCGDTVSNTHTGPCMICGGTIGRVVPKGTRLDADLGIVMPLREFVPKAVEPPRPDWTNVALVAAVVSCIGSPLLGASSAGWNAVAIVMALNIWSSSISYYALALIGRREQQAV